MSNTLKHLTEDSKSKGITTDWWLEVNNGERWTFSCEGSGVKVQLSRRPENKLYLAVQTAFLNAVILAVTPLTPQSPSNCFHLLECIGSCRTAVPCRSYNAGAPRTTLCESSSNSYCVSITASFVTCPLKGIHFLFSDWVGWKPRASNVRCGC